ncbi:MAG: hypothetical protein AAF152_20445 [Cyanobacteria bacterium P01_A01_bin.114]
MLNNLKYQASIILVSLTAIGVSMPAAQAEDPLPAVTCAYDPESGLVNPLGMRSFVSLQEISGNTNVIFDQFPAAVAGATEATLASQRVLTLYGMNVSEARQLMLSNPEYYNTLLGFESPDGFGPVNNVLACKVVNGHEGNPGEPLPELETTQPNQGTPSSAATSSTLYETIAALPDGNYRYWSAQSEFRIVDDQELLNGGGVLFVFRKAGNQVVGSYAYIDGDAICVSGRVSGNTLSGQAYPDGGEVRDLAEAFEPWGPAGFLQVRRSQRLETGDFYDSAILNLNDFSRINAGQTLPPETCGAEG